MDKFSCKVPASEANYYLNSFPLIVKEVLKNFIKRRRKFSGHCKSQQKKNRKKLQDEVNFVCISRLVMGSCHFLSIVYKMMLLRFLITSLIR